MGSPTGEIQVELEGDEIVVTKRGTRYLLAYRKSVITAARDDSQLDGGQLPPRRG